MARHRVWTRAALAFCVAFGTVLIASVQLAAEGSWYWYGHLARGGTRLYSDLHFSLQPLFVLETEIQQATLGTSWIASKVPAILHLLAFAFGMYLLARRSTWSDRQQAIVLICAFFVGIKFEAYRFDDYHALADIFCFYTMLLLLTLDGVRSARFQLAVTSALGVLTGLTLVLRLNDGLALAAFSALAILWIVPKRRLPSLISYILAFAATVVLTVAATGDSLVMWATYSVLHVGAIKGGTAQFASDPIRIFVSAYDYIVTTGRPILIELLLVALSWSLLLTSFSKKHQRAAIARLALGAFISAYSLYFLFPAIKDGSVVVAVHAIITWLALLGSLLVAARACNLFDTRNRIGRQPKEILFLLPLLMLASGSLSSAGSFSDLYEYSGFVLLLFPIVWPYPKPGWTRSTVLVVLLLTALSGVCYRFNDPASWIDYRTSHLFADRRVVVHPAFGPMVIDNRLLQFITPICAVINDGERQPELLSIPWAYANYYCNIAPWHGFVQTWFDTSSKAYIDDLVAQLRSSPPKWILYQRQLGTLANHELLYNQGLAIPQRALDTFIVGKIDDGEWRVVRRENYGADSDWILIRTRWDLSHGSNLLSNPTGAKGLTGWYERSEVPLWSRNPAGRGFVVSFKGTDETASNLSHDVTFRRDGPVRLQARIGTTNIASGHHGYSVDLYDVSNDTVVSSLGWSNFNEAPRDQGFIANVLQQHPYRVRLLYQATGEVSFASVAFSYEPSTLPGSSPIAHAPLAAARLERIQTSTLAGWMPSGSAPKWLSDSHGGRGFVVAHDTPETAESTLHHNIRFKRTGPVTVQVTIGAEYLDAANGYGYVVDLYDATSNAIAGSLGVPATVSEPRLYSFGASVDRHHEYEVRLRYNAARGKVTFSRLKIEEGTRPTSWSDEATNLPVVRSRTATPKSRPATGQ